MRRLIHVLLTSGVLSMVGCSANGPISPHQSLGGDPSLLRTVFQTDSGKVRLILLLSPT